MRRAVLRDLFDDANAGDAWVAAKNAQLIARSAQLGHYQEKIRRSISAIFGAKAVFALVGNCFIKERHAQKILSGELRIAADVLVGLLRSNEGYKVLELLMDGSKATWWGGIAEAYDDIEIDRQINELKAKKRRTRGGEA